MIKKIVIFNALLLLIHIYMFNNAYLHAFIHNITSLMINILIRSAHFETVFWCSLKATPKTVKDSLNIKIVPVHGKLLFYESM